MIKDKKKIAVPSDRGENKPVVMRRLTTAQQREYDLLKKHGSVYVYGLRRRQVFERLVEIGLAENIGGHHWFHLNGA